MLPVCWVKRTWLRICALRNFGLWQSVWNSRRLKVARDYDLAKMGSLVSWLCVGFAARLIVILYGMFHDRWFNVPFTDVDYFVFSDAAQNVALGGSPYDRQTYRYPPLLAWILVPNVIYPIWGKILFSGFDVLVRYSTLFTSRTNNFLLQVSALLYEVVRGQKFSKDVALKCSLFWLLNPVSIIISSRGNSDSLIAAVVLMALAAATGKRPALAGLLLGLAIHVRLYPIVFSLPIYLSFRTRTQSFSWLKLLVPNKQQLVLVSCCVWFLVTSTAFCYYLYGDQYLNESILYHITRKDTRHNFSLFFYLLYLNPEQSGLLLFFPQALLLLVFSAAFHKTHDLPFCLFAQSFVVVTYNPVVTSQYWVWVLSLLPTSLPRLKINLRTVVLLSGLWGLAQIAWLVPAYFLEFRGRNTFFFIWLQSIGVFCANLAVLGRLVRAYDYVQKTD